MIRRMFTNIASAFERKISEKERRYKRELVVICRECLLLSNGPVTFGVQHGVFHPSRVAIPKRLVENRNDVIIDILPLAGTYTQRRGPDIRFHKRLIPVLQQDGYQQPAYGL